jgi:hypothetical protein
MVEIEKGGLERTIEALKKDAMAFANDKTAKRVKKLAEEMMGQLVEEKAKLYTLTRKLSWSVKKRDMEARNREKALQEELKRRDEMLKKKDVTVGHVRSQMAQLNMNMERLKNTAHGAVEDQQYRKRFDHLQKLYLAAKDESMRHLREIDKLKKQLTQARYAAVSTPGPVTDETNELRETAEKTKRQAEEFRRMNKQLVDRISQLEKHKASSLAGGRVDEMRDRLEQAMKTVTTAKAETEELKAKATAAEADSVRLGKELEHTRDTLRRAMEKMRRYMERQGRKGDGGPSSTGAA